MKTFKDSRDNNWNVVINVGQIKRLRDRLDIDVARMFEDEAKVYRELIGDPVAFVNLMFVICEEQANARNVTDVQFGEAFDGDTYERAIEAFYEEMVLFFPKRQRDTLTAVNAKMNQARDRAVEMASERVNALDINQIAEQMLSGSATNSRGS